MRKRPKSKGSATLRAFGFWSFGIITLSILFALQLARERRLRGENDLLAPNQLGDLARRMVETKDPAEADRLQEEIVRGFYGSEPHA